MIVEEIVSASGPRRLPGRAPELAGESRPARATNLAGSRRSVSRRRSRGPPCPSSSWRPRERGEAWLADLESLLGEGRVGWYPQWEILPYEPRAPQREIEGQRLEFLAGLLEGSVRVGVTTVRAALQKILSPAALGDRLLRLATGDAADLDDLARRLVRMGFERESMVAEVGTFSIRGGIVDVFGYRYADPVRLELAGDRVESIRAFDLATQRSLAPLEGSDPSRARAPPDSAGEDEDGDPTARSDVGRSAEGPRRVAPYRHAVVRDEPRVAAAPARREEVRAAGEASARDRPAPEDVARSETFERGARSLRRPTSRDSTCRATSARSCSRRAIPIPSTFDAPARRDLGTTSRRRLPSSSATPRSARSP